MSRSAADTKGSRTATDYIVKEKDGFIAIYTVDDNGKEILKEKTKISTEYLTQTDLIKIKDGIRANGREELNAVLEDFE